MAESLCLSRIFIVSKSREDSAREMLKQDQLGARLAAYLSSIEAKYALLLVYDAMKTLNALSKLGVDVSTYTEGIDILLYGPDRVITEREADRERKPWKSETSTRRRSLSPRRKEPIPARARSPDEKRFRPVSRDAAPNAEATLAYDAADNGEAEDEEGDDEPPPPAKIFVIDIQSMFLAMSKLDIRNLKDLLDVGRRLGITFDEAGGPSNACS